MGKKYHRCFGDFWLREALPVWERFGLGQSTQTENFEKTMQELPPEDLHMVEAKTTISAAEYQKFAEEFVKDIYQVPLRQWL